MQKFKITGKKQLSGEIAVSGAKNAALKILPATILSKEKCVIKNMPFIEDIQRMFELLESLGAKVEKNKQTKTVTVDPSGIKGTEMNPNLIKKLRSSILLAGPLLARFGQVKMSHPGGCVIGQRPIDLFLDGFEKLGAEIKWQEDSFTLSAQGGRLKGNNIFFPKITVTGTETLMMSAVLAEGKTILENCAMEPEIPALADYLNKCGAKIKGAGTPTIEIEGVDSVGGGEFEIIPDRIEAATFVIMGLVTQSNIKVTNCVPKHLGALLPILEKTGAKIKIGKDYIETFAGQLKATSIVTHEYPGFASDFQPPFTLLMSQAEGLSLIQETIYDGRLFFTDQLSAMGAKIIMCDPHRVVISGPTPLFARKLVSPDLRAGITMVIAGLIAEGTTIVDNIYQIDRGYENIEERLKALGAQIERIEE